MSDVTDPREPHPEPVPTPEDAPAQIPPEVAEAVAHGEPSPVIEGGSPYIRPPAAHQHPAGGRSGTRVLIALGFLLLFGAVAWEYLREDHMAKHLSALARGQNQDPARVDALGEALRAETAARTALGEQVDTLKAAPPQAAGSPPTSQPATDLGPIDARLKDVEQKLAALTAAPKPDATAPAGASPPPVDLGPIDARLNGLEQKIAGLAAAPKSDAGGTAPAVPAAPAADLGPIEARLKALEDKPAPAPAPAPAPPPSPAPDVALLARVNSIADQLDGLGKKLAKAQSQAESAQASAQAAQSRATVALTRAAATVALDDGKPLGVIPHAPPALARFATEAPPTEASLRLSYDDAAAKAQDASVPPTAGKKFGARMLTRIESLVTVSQGDHVLVGPPAATILAAAHEKLQAGDLAGAVAALDGLDPAAAAAMAPWRDRAKALLDARAALQSSELGAP